MKKKLNDAQKNAFRLIEILRTKNTTIPFYFLVVLIILTSISFVKIFYDNTQGSNKRKACAIFKRDALIHMQAKIPFGFYLQEKVDECKKEYSGFNLNIDPSDRHFNIAIKEFCLRLKEFKKRNNTAQQKSAESFCTKTLKRKTTQ